RGSTKVAKTPAPGGLDARRKNDRYGTSRLPPRSHRGAAVSQDRIGIRLDQLRHISPHAIGVAGGPASIDAKIAAFRPPEFLQPLAQGRNASLSVCIVRSQHYYGEAPHTLGLLRARRERPRGRRAAEHDDALAPSYVGHGATSPALDRRHPTMTTRRPTAHAVGLLHAESTMEDGVESLGADLKCSESSPDRYCPAVVSLKVRIEPTRPYESFDRAR